MKSLSFGDGLVKGRGGFNGIGDAATLDDEGLLKVFAFDFPLGGIVVLEVTILRFEVLQ